MTVTVSTPFRVQVRAPGATRARPPLASIDSFAFEGRRPLPNSFADPQTGQRGRIYFQKHTNFQFCPDDGRIYGYGGDGEYVGTGSQSSAIHLVRLTLSSAASPSLTYDNPYPWWGIAGVPFPVGQDNCPFIHDSTRGCFWIVGGYYAQTDNLMWNDPRIIGNKMRYGIWRFWTRGAQAGTYELVQPFAGNAPFPPEYAHGEGMGGSYVPRIDCLVWMGYGSIGTAKRLAWYNCASGASGICDSGAYAESAPRFPNVAVGAESPAVSQYPTVYDAVKNELIWQYCGSGNNGHGGIYATKLDNWPGPLSTRQLWWGWVNSISSMFGQAPIWIRGRRLYGMITPFGYGGDRIGNGLGIWELELESPNTMRQASMPQFEERSSGFAYYPAYPINEGAYDPVKDMFVGTAANGGAAFLFRYSPPSWTPSAGTVTDIPTDSFGAATNSFHSVRPPAGVYAGLNNNPFAWASACYARDLSTNGAMLINNGGDGDYWGTEIYCFDFDTRKWFRLSDPTTAMSGDPPADKARSPSDPRYFNRGECEHGPAVADYGTGLLPPGTTPGVPHNYDGVMYLPGSVIGNRRGALVRPHSQVVYTTDGTGRTHYFDLDEMKWGRLSANKGGPNQNPLISGQIPIIGYDKQAGRIYHAYGYLDLATRLHTNRAWVNRSMETKGCFDPVRRLWLMPRMGGFGEGTSAAPGTLMACAVDSSSTFVELPFAFSAGSQAWLRGQAWQAGLEYFDELDCFFFYCCGTAGANSPTPGTAYATRQKIWRIQPPSSNPLTNPWTVTEITMPGGAVQASGVQGTYGRFFRVPPLKCLAFYNGPANGGKVYLYKPQGV